MNRDWLQFQQPFDNRDHLADEFDKLFGGTEAILEEDVGEYRDLLNKSTTAQGRLLAADLRIHSPARVVTDLMIKIIKSYHLFERWGSPPGPEFIHGAVSYAVCPSRRKEGIAGYAPWARNRP